MRIGILGGGFVGLTCAYRLAKSGHEVVLLEKEKNVGGLASGFKLDKWDWFLDYHYHHLFTSDKYAINLLKEIGREKDLIFRKPKTKIYYEPSVIARSETTNQSQTRLPRSLRSLAMTNNNFSFDSPIDLLSFPHLSIIDRLRTGLVMAFLKFNPFWQGLEKVTADEWLNKYMGGKAYQVLWEPLFVGKFGVEAKNISMAWFWARIYKRSSSLGYIKGGFQNFANKLAEEIKKAGGKILLDTTINSVIPAPCLPAGRKAGIYINNNYHFDKVICTLPTSSFLKITSDLPSDYLNKLKNIKHLDCLNLILILKKKFFTDNTYWLNINDAQVPFLAVVEHTNFMDSKNYDGNYLVYVGNYLPKDHKFFKMSKEELLAVFDPYLKKLNPDYRKNLAYYFTFRGQDAQPIITVNYSKKIPDFVTPLANLYLANMDMVYPWDRGTNYAIELGEKIAKIVNK